MVCSSYFNVSVYSGYNSAFYWVTQYAIGINCLNKMDTLSEHLLAAHFYYSWNNFTNSWSSSIVDKVIAFKLSIAEWPKVMSHVLLQGWREAKHGSATLKAIVCCLTSGLLSSFNCKPRQSRFPDTVCKKYSLI